MTAAMVGRWVDSVGAILISLYIIWSWARILQGQVNKVSTSARTFPPQTFNLFFQATYATGTVQLQYGVCLTTMHVSDTPFMCRSGSLLNSFGDSHTFCKEATCMIPCRLWASVHRLSLCQHLRAWPTRTTRTWLWTSYAPTTLALALSWRHAAAPSMLDHASVSHHAWP